MAEQAAIKVVVRKLYDHYFDEDMRIELGHEFDQDKPDAIAKRVDSISENQRVIYASAYGMTIRHILASDISTENL